MRVALMSTFGQMCGLSEYAANLIRHSNGVEFEVYEQNRWSFDALMAGKWDVLHVNYANGQLGCEDTVMHVLHRRNHKGVVTQHLSNEVNNYDTFISSFKKVVVHEKAPDGSIFIPMGVPEVDLSNELQVGTFFMRIGTVGFPFPWKSLPEVAAACKILGLACSIIAPETCHANTHAVEQQVKSQWHLVDYDKSWQPFDAVVKKLNQNAVNVFAYNTAGRGPYIDVGTSSAVRMGLAARRPVVVTRTCRQFRDLLDYEDEIEFADSHHPQHLAEAIQRVLANGKRPNRILKDMSWTTVANQYKSLYQEIA